MVIYYKTDIFCIFQPLRQLHVAAEFLKCDWTVQCDACVSVDGRKGQCGPSAVCDCIV